MGNVPSCVLLDWRCGSRSGVWDVMYRVEHTVWAQLRISGKGGGYFENLWLWVADHDFVTGNPIVADSPRGLLLQSNGPTWLYGVAAEHSSEYQYFLDGATDVTMVVTQSESPYWQDPPTALAMKIHNADRIWSYGAAYEVWFHGIQATLQEVTASRGVYLYSPNTYNASFGRLCLFGWFSFVCLTLL